MVRQRVAPGGYGMGSEPAADGVCVPSFEVKGRPLEKAPYITSICAGTVGIG
jgi:hypothetical protein